MAIIEFEDFLESQERFVTDETQFVKLASFRAKLRYQPDLGDWATYLAKVEHDAKIDWRRLQQYERERQQQTVRIDDLIDEPAVKSHFGAIETNDAVEHILTSIDALLAEALRLRYLQGNRTLQAAIQLGVTASDFKNTLRQALRAARNVPIV